VRSSYGALGAIGNTLAGMTDTQMAGSRADSLDPAELERYLRGLRDELSLALDKVYVWLEPSEKVNRIRQAQIERALMASPGRM
jgi:hypothetical protein